AGRGEPERAVSAAKVHVQPALLQLLEQDPAVAVDDRLRQAGGARGVQDPQGMVEGNLLESQLGALATARELLPHAPAGTVRRLVQVGHEDAMLDRGQLLEDALEDRRAVEVPAAVAVAVYRDQHLRLDLGKPVDHAASPELRRGARPYRPDARGREER